MGEYNGLDLNMGNLYRLSNARTRSISPENWSGEAGRGGMASEGTGAEAARDLGVGWKISPSIKIAPGENCVLAEIDGPGAIQHIWMTPSGRLAAPDPAHLLGRRGKPIRGMPGGRFLRLRLEPVRPGQLAGGVRQPRKRFELLLAHAFPTPLQDHHDQPGRERGNSLLPDHLHSDGSAGRYRLLPRPVPQI